MNKLRFLPRLALVLALLLAVWFLSAMFGAKWGLIDKLTAFGTMTVGIGGMAAMVVAGVAAIALLVALLVKPRQGWVQALVALAIPLAVLVGFSQLRATAQSVPFLYDITTNTGDAPQYSAAMVKARDASGANPLLDFAKPLGAYEKWKDNAELSGKTAAQVIAEGYPDLATLETDRSVEDALTAISDAMKLRGFENVRMDKAQGLVEATAVVFWYGFEDDVLARVRPSPTGASIDFRSTSRVGTSDLGVNAQRIADLSAAVKDRLAKDFPQVEEIQTGDAPAKAGEEAAN